MTSDGPSGTAPYQALTLARLAPLLVDADESTRWRLVAEFLKEYRWEPANMRPRLVEEEPDGTGDKRWDVFHQGGAGRCRRPRSRCLPATRDIRCPTRVGGRVTLVPDRARLVLEDIFDDMAPR